MHQRQVLRLGTAMIVLAVAIRLLSAGFFHPLVDTFRNQKLLSFLFYLETGYPLRPLPQGPVPTEPQATDPAPPPTQPISSSQLPTFDPAELALITVTNHSDYTPELSNLLTQPLSWDLTGENPTILILHSHATETYSDVTTSLSSPYRTLDETYNMISIGKELKRVLEDNGICVIHDTTLHDHPDYNAAYTCARSTIETYLAKYPTIRMVLDLHRDASDLPTGQLTTSAIAGGQKAAQMMMVVGTDAGGNHHPNWQENLALALKLTALLERTDPGISRPIDLRTQRFNMDLSAGSLLIEVGAAGDTHKEALIAVNALAQAIIELSHGCA